jgi:catechol 2,3-dioxygenase-like lactoylglutathione lyase family enzyme
MARDAPPAGPATARLLPRPIHHVGFNVPDLRAAIDSWVSVYGVGPFYVNEHVAYDECTSSGIPAMWDHSAGFGQWGAVPVELQQTHDLRPAELARPFTVLRHGGRRRARLGWTRPDPQPRVSSLSSGRARLLCQAMVVWSAVGRRIGGRATS